MIPVIAAFIVSAAAIYIASAFRCGRDPVFAVPAYRVPFLLLSVTWGLPMTLIGALSALLLLISGHKPKIFGCCVLFELPKISFGLSLGIFIIAPEGDIPVKEHEHGHSIQNIYFGPFMPFCVGIPSVVRYWYRKIKAKTKKPCKTTYDHVWYEGSATESGSAFINKFRNKEIKRNEQKNARR